MSIPVQDAAEALVPFFSAGAGAALSGLAKEAGSSLSEATLGALERIRGTFAGGEVRVPQVESALNDALADGSLSESDLTLIAALQPVIQKTYVVRSDHNSYVDNVIKINGGGSFNG